MTMIRWNPYRGMVTMNKELENLFDDFFVTTRRGTEENTGVTWAPDVDLTESKEAYTLRAELPGVAKEDVKVTLNKDVLTISGEKKYAKEVKEENIYRSERTYGSFCRSFTLPTAIDAEKVNAEYREGILTLSIPKAESSKPREIEIK